MLIYSKEAREIRFFVCKACQKTKFPVAMEIEMKPKTVPNHNGRVGF